VAVAVCLTILPSLGQHNTPPDADVSALLAKLRSSDGGERAQAYEKLRSDSMALEAPKVRAALVDLLDRENLESDSRMREALRRAKEPTHKTKGENEARGEGWAEYFSELVSTVASIADWSDPHQVCILAKAGYIPDSLSPSEAALRERVALPCLIQMSGSDLMLDRANATQMLIQLSAQARDALDANTGQQGSEIVLRALYDQDEGVRSETVKSLEQFGTQEIIPALKQVAESDPAVDKVNHSYWIREYAAKAIAAIQQRAGQH